MRYRRRKRKVKLKDKQSEERKTDVEIGELSWEAYVYQRSQERGGKETIILEPGKRERRN